MRAKFDEVRAYLSNEIEEMALPWKPLPCQSGYFLICDISACRPLIPASYFESHEYETGISINRVSMPDGKIPQDLAFVRWMGQVNGVTMMPCSFFYHSKSPYRSENFVRVAICKDIESVKKVCARLRAIK